VVRHSDLNQLIGMVTKTYVNEIPSLGIYSRRSQSERAVGASHPAAGFCCRINLKKGAVMKKVKSKLESLGLVLTLIGWIWVIGIIIDGGISDYVREGGLILVVGSGIVFYKNYVDKDD
jgi:hypothetical protein